MNLAEIVIVARRKLRTRVKFKTDSKKIWNYGDLDFHIWRSRFPYVKILISI